MAGVGFELKKLFRSKEGYFQKAQGFAVSTAVTQGPMLLNILLLFLLQFLIDLDGGEYMEREWFLYTVTYATIFSLILSNAILMFIDRYVSDCIYTDEIDRILPSFHGLMVLLLILGGFLAGAYLSACPRGPVYKLVSWLQFLLLLIVWSEMSYLSALKQYSKVLIGFLASVLVAVLLGIWLIIFTSMDRLNAALIAITTGYGVMVVMFYQQMLLYYPKGRTDLFGWLSALEEYKILIAIGLFMALGLYAHNFVYWFSPLHNEIWRAGVFCTRYDVPTFYATLTITPMLVLFVVSVETKVYRNYRGYFDAILHGGTLEDVMQAHKSLETAIFRELINMGTLQLFITILCATLIGNVLNGMGLDQEQTEIYRILCFGYCLYGLAKCEIILMLYFEDRKGALAGAAMFFFTTVVGSVINIQLESLPWGMGYLAGAFLTTIYGTFRLQYFLKKLEYKVFLRQPLFFHEKDGPIRRFAQRMMRREMMIQQKMKPHLKKDRRDRTYEKV